MFFILFKLLKLYTFYTIIWGLGLILVDQFIFMCSSYDLSIFSIVSNLSGGLIEYYNYFML